MNILLIEDNAYKKDQIYSFVENLDSSIHIELRKSYNSGLREIIKNRDYSLVLLDMSLPNYDIAPGETGGDFENAGELILKEMYRRNININVAIVTMYRNYVNDEINTKLKLSFSNYLGVVYFDINDPDGWKSELHTIINSQV